MSKCYSLLKWVCTPILPLVYNCCKVGTASAVEPKTFTFKKNYSIFLVFISTSGRVVFILKLVCKPLQNLN